MSTAVIIGGGEFPRKEYPRELIHRADVIVCCDGNALKAFLRNRGKIFKETVREPDGAAVPPPTPTSSAAASSSARR